eukprot:TRINITY_DN24734_c0_g2_i1.p1 TRINITY_DN24734_c0_g2~~TRINITY_DN24734_c0_g2_i1.p1  ORF type:complete len:431 (-),score=59.60 TRINITY_DN24734_c0_g2_i1:123-1415(-)
MLEPTWRKLDSFVLLLQLYLVMPGTPRLRFEGSDAADLVDAISNVVEGAAEALRSVTEATLGDAIESAFGGLAATLGTLAAQLPRGQEECEQALRQWQAISDQSRLALQMVQETQVLDEHGRRLSLHPWPSSEGPSPISVEETQNLMRIVQAALLDVRAALNEMERDEIDELADVSLAVARMAISITQKTVRQMKDSVHKQSIPAVIIEDLGEMEGAQGVNGMHFQGSHSERAHYTFSTNLQSHRFLWRPLWPRLKTWGENPSLPTLAAPPTVAIAMLIFAWPLCLIAALFAFWSAILALPCVLLADTLLQHFYSSRQRQVDECIDGALQVARLWYLTVRITLRRTARIARAQARRALGGRPLVEVIRTWLQHPATSALAGAQLLAHVVVSASREASRLVLGVYTRLPPWKDFVQSTKTHLECLWGFLGV